LIKDSYKGAGFIVIHGGLLTKRFNLESGVRQRCLLSPFLFILVIDLIMKTCTKQKRNGIRWALKTQLEDLDFIDDLAMLFHNHQHMQEKTSELSAISPKVGLNIHKG